MSRLRALVTATFSAAGLSQLRECMDVEYHNWFDQRRAFSEDELFHMLRDKDIFIFEEEMVTRRLLEEHKSLKVLACCRGLRGDSPDTDVPYCQEHSIPILVAPGRNAHSVAEMTILLTLGVLRQLPVTLRWLHEHQWKNPKDFITTFRTNELAGKTVGIIGFGNIGRRAAAIFKAFGVRLLAADPYVNDPALYAQYDVEHVDLDTLLRESDVVSLHMNVSAETKGMIGARELALMKPTAILINTARAVLVDHDALYDALANRRIAGAGVDVFHVEPANPSNEPLLRLDNFFATPHVGGTAWEVANYHSAMIVDGLFRLLRGEKPAHMLNPEVLDQFWAKNGIMLQAR